MNPNDSINKDSTITSNDLVDLSQVLLDATKTNYQIVNDPASHLVQQPNIATATGTTASPYIIQNGNIYQLTANNQLISRNTIQLNQIVSSNTQQNEVLLQTTPVNLQSAPKQIIINQPNQNNRIRMTTIKNGSTFLNLNTKGKVIYRTTNSTTNNDPITTSSPLLASNLTSTPQIRTINIQQPQQITAPKQIIISNGTANNTSRLSALINNNNKPHPSIIVLAPNSNTSIQQQQKPITLKSVIEQPQTSLKPINSMKPLSVTKIQSLNDSNQQLQYYLSNSPATSTQFLNDSNSNQLIKSLISNDKPQVKLDSFVNDDLFKQEELDAEFNQKSVHTVQADLNSVLLDNNTFAKTKNHKEMVKITPIAVQPKSANIIQSILNRPVTFVTNNIQQPQTIVTQPQKITQTKPAHVVQTVQLNNEVKNQSFIKIAAKKEANLQIQQQHIQQQQQQQLNNQEIKQSIPQQQLIQKQVEIDENIMPNESCLNDLLLPDTRIFASLLNKDSNGAVAAASASANKDPNSKKRVLTDLTYKTVLIGNSEHIILDNVQNLADFRGDFTKLQNLAIAVANRFNKPVTIPAFLLIDNKFSLDKVKESLNEKNIHPIIIETAANQTQSTQQQQTAKPTQTNQQKPEHFKEQNHYIIQTLNKQPPAVEEQQQLPPAQIINKKTTAAANKRNKNESASAKGDQPVQKKPRKQKAAKAPNAKYLSSLATGTVSESESANNTPNKNEQQINPVNTNINVSNLSVNQILKLDQQQQQQHLQQQDQNSTQILNSFISEQMIMSNNQQIIANELDMKNYNFQIVDNNMQLQQQQQLPIQIEQTHNIVYVQQDQQFDQSIQTYVIQQNDQQLQVNQQQQQQQVDQQLFANPNTEYDFTTFDPFDSNALFNLNEMEFI